MDEAETRALMEDVAAVMKSLVANAIGPISERLSALEKRVSDLPAPKDVDEAAIVDRVRDGLACDLSSLQEIVRTMIEEAVSALPKPKDGEPGKSITVEDVAPLIDERVKAAVAELPAPDVKGLVAEHVAEAVAAIPKPKDGEPGKSVTVEDVRPLVAVEVQKAVAEIPKPQDGKDGRGLAGMLIDRDGELVATMTDGRTEKLGIVVGRDGRDADMAALEKHITEAVAAIPRPKDGADGVGFDDLDLEITDSGAYFRFVKGERVKRIPVPMIIDRGVYREGVTYHKGASVTWGGCIWIAQHETSDKPGTSEAWRLSVKKGRDGKDAK